MKVTPGDLDNLQVIDLLRLHLAGMHANSPPGHVFALDLSGLRRSDISFFTAWDGGALLGCGALRELSPTHGEIKSMRTAPQHLRRGVAATLLRHMLGTARMRGYRRVSLETGSGDAFEPALALYRREGFVNGDAFGDYEKSPFNQFLHLDLPKI
jgi:putative acetyltransferase